ncbi:MAG: preprotein translocase subunit SecE [Candidatus Fraserbacteria bacterium RBG_16_55_9]|uniref:Protein translocase subunit SecE n=1 Tax=Fraserbacteria sp. (strain RBG_16_55_9) TaxID=1817864 RepID=A0A1F5UPG4_FRAXR|nr:MAG: preprotein translocase subunit SecE [Candidatus Fraserbacteria bacterium RBG_16_55_9]
MLERVIQFFREVRVEFSKINWPSRLETVVLTVLVISMVVILAVIIFAYDVIFSGLIQKLFELFGIR